MAEIVFNCPLCDSRLAVEAEGAGMELPCPSCHGPIKVPDPAFGEEHVEIRYAEPDKPLRGVASRIVPPGEPTPPSPPPEPPPPEPAPAEEAAPPPPPPSKSPAGAPSAPKAVIPPADRRLTPAVPSPPPPPPRTPHPPPKAPVTKRGSTGRGNRSMVAAARQAVPDSATRAETAEAPATRPAEPAAQETRRRRRRKHDTVQRIEDLTGPFPRFIDGAIVALSILVLVLLVRFLVLPAPGP